MPISINTPEAANAFIASMDTFLLDCDGVLWRGDHVLKNVREVLKLLRSLGKRILFVTNNSTKSREDSLKKFQSLNIEANLDEIFVSSYAAAYYIKNFIKLPEDKRVYVVGQKGITDELKAENIRYCGSSEDDQSISLSEWSSCDFPSDSSIGAVVFGFDLQFNYKKLAKAYRYLESCKSCHFIATNDDLTYPTMHGILPGTGSLLASLMAPLASLNRFPTVIGKPNQPMLDCIISKYHLDVNRTCMVGDRLDTDIAFGKNGGLTTLLVLTGVTEWDDLNTSSIQPNYVIESFGHLVGSNFVEN